MTLLVEPARESSTASAGSASGRSVSYYGDPIYTKVRRMVVVRENPESCVCLLITSYSNRGVAKPGVKKSDHAIVYSGRRPPDPLLEEAPTRGEAGLLPGSIRVTMDDLSDKLTETSRLNFARPYTVDHNVRVRNLGVVHPRSIEALKSHFQSVLGFRTFGTTAALHSELALPSETSEHLWTKLQDLPQQASEHERNGQWMEARDLRYRYVREASSVFGADHPYTLTGKEDLATTWQMLGNFGEEEALRSEIVGTLSKTCGDEHPSTLAAMESLATVYRLQGRFSDEQGLRERVLQTRRRILGNLHPDMQAAVRQLATVYRVQGRLAEAQDLMAEASSLEEQQIGHLTATMDRSAEDGHDASGADASASAHVRGAFVEESALSTTPIDLQR